MLNKGLLILFILLCSIVAFSNTSGDNIANYKPGLYELKSEGRGFTHITVGGFLLMGLNNLGQDWGFELRTRLDNNHYMIPLEWFYFAGDARIRSWPVYFFTDRKRPQDSSVYISFFSSGYVKKDQNDNSHAEFGPGAGFIASGILNIGVWLTTNVTQGSASVREIFGFRTRVELSPDPFYIMFGMRLGTAILTTTNYTTSSTTIDLELEFGYRIWKELRCIIGIEGHSDNFGALLDSDAEATNIDSAFQLILKLGISYKFF